MKLAENSMQKMKVAILKGNGVYRMGDAIYRKGIWRRVRRMVLAGDEYDSTILKSYLLAMKSEKHWALLKTLVSEAVNYN